MTYAFVVTLREGLEAALIIGIMLAYLDKSRRGGSSYVWAGALSALTISLATAVGLFLTASQLSGPALEIFEGTAMLVAVTVLTAMMFWMKRQASTMKGNLQHRMDEVTGGGQDWTLALLAFTVVIREGIELALFLLAGAFRSGGLVEYGLGGLFGLGLAAVLGYAIYRGAGVLPLRSFFNVTGVLLMFFAAGMLVNAFGEFHELGLVAPIIGHVWDTYNLLPDSAGFGWMLAALFGYSASPSLVQVLAWSGYLSLTLAYYFWPRAARPSRAVRAPAPQQ